MRPNDRPAAVSRRQFVQTAALVSVVGAAPATTAAAQTDEPFDGWFDDVPNYDGVTDRTGEREVSIAVGAGDGFRFDPPAVRVDPGTSVVWEWYGEGGAHDVSAEDGSFESELLSSEGATFEHTFEDEGARRYACTPHRSMGMKGAVVVGDVDVGASATGDAEPFREPDYGGWFDDVENFDGTVDATGQDEVRIAVGAEGNGGAFAFEPAAVQVDPGTTVVWEWTGDGGGHNVVEAEGEYESPMQGEAGATYALTFDGRGVSRYLCGPHESAGMKGAVVVGNPAATGGAGGGISPLRTALWGLVAAIIAAPLVASEIVLRRRRREGDDRGGVSGA